MTCMKLLFPLNLLGCSELVGDNSTPGSSGRKQINTAGESGIERLHECCVRLPCTVDLVSI